MINICSHGNFWFLNERGGISMVNEHLAYNYAPFLVIGYASVMFLRLHLTSLHLDKDRL